MKRNGMAELAQKLERRDLMKITEVWRRLGYKGRRHFFEQVKELYGRIKKSISPNIVAAAMQEDFRKLAEGTKRFLASCFNGKQFSTASLQRPLEFKGA